MTDYTGTMSYFRWRSAIKQWDYPHGIGWPREARFYENLGRFYLMDLMRPLLGEAS